MPLTPLHFGVLAPVNHFAPGKVNNVSFILVNLWVDLHAIFWWLSDYEYSSPSHGLEHTFLGILPLVLLVGLMGALSMKWWRGAFLGGFTHIVLDALVHPDVAPFDPLVMGNPLYADLMAPLSAVLLVLCVWLTLQFWSYIRATIVLAPAGPPRGTAELCVADKETTPQVSENTAPPPSQSCSR